MSTQTELSKLFDLKTIVTAAVAFAGAYGAIMVSQAKLEVEVTANKQAVVDMRSQLEELSRVDTSVAELKRDIKYISESVQRIERKIESN